MFFDCFQTELAANVKITWFWPYCTLECGLWGRISHDPACTWSHSCISGKIYWMWKNCLNFQIGRFEKTVNELIKQFIEFFHYKKLKKWCHCPLSFHDWATFWYSAKIDNMYGCIVQLAIAAFPNYQFQLIMRREKLARCKELKNHNNDANKRKTTGK